MPVGSPLGREVVVDGEPKLMFGSNNYLGLADDPRVAEAARAAVDRYGTGCTGSRLMNGTLDLHLELEHELADWMQREAALVFTAGYLANLATHRDAVRARGRDRHRRQEPRVDRGRRAAVGRARVVRVRHNDLDQLAAKLGRLAQDGRAMVVWDSVFSMEGDVVDLPTAARGQPRRGRPHAHRRGALARACSGPTAAGVAVGLDPAADLVMGTFSKSLASCGGVIAGDRDVIEHLRIHARPFVFTASAVPAAVGAAQAAVRICGRRAVARRARRSRSRPGSPTGSARSAHDVSGRRRGDRRGAGCPTSGTRRSPGARCSRRAST